jgi:sucrose-6-phosphate hydrolase SacC (GH32 family)
VGRLAVVIMSLFALQPASAVAQGAGDLSLMDDLDAWTATGTAFNTRLVSDAADLKKLEISNAGDSPVITSELEGDEPRGTLTSPPFRIDRKYIGFRIGGGNYESHTCMDLLIDGKPVRRAIGARSDILMPDAWDVSAWAGRTAQIRIIDDTGGEWGHINVSHLKQTDTPEQLPVNTGPLYHEALRPQFHFTARQFLMNRLNPREREEGWINDLNGLIYYEGEWHLMGQRWAKCWLHAVSKDLIHWTELEPAFWEESNGSGVQSGYVVIDYANTSKLSPDPKTPPMVAFWSRFDNRSQCISYSLDKGRTWKRYEKNPIFVKAERDPKVFWYEPGKHWVMVMYGDGQYHILNSPDLLSWTDTGNPIADSFECPDLFQLPLDGDQSKTQWVLVQGDGKYTLGDFDGRKFTATSDRHVIDAGDFYATQSWHNTETGDGRRIQVAWMRGANFPDMPFSQMISFPCELTLRTTPQGPRIFRQPVKELESLQKDAIAFDARTLGKDQALQLAAQGRQYRIKAEVEIPEGSRLRINVRGTPITFTRKEIDAAGKRSSVAGQVTSIDLLIDTTSVETFVNDGEVSITRFMIPNENNLWIRAEDGPVTIKSLTMFPLRSAWPAN